MADNEIAGSLERHQQEPVRGIKDSVQDLQGQLASFSHQRSPGHRKSRSNKTVLLVCLALIALSASAACTGIYLRGQFQQGNSGRSHIHIRVSSHPRAIQPHNHSTSLHAEAQKLREIAQSPEQLQFYLSMATAEREAWMAEEISLRSSPSEFLDGNRCQGLRQIYQPLVNDLLAPFKEGFSVAYLKKLKRAPSAIIYIKHGKIYVEGLEGDLRHPLVILWADYLYWLLQEVKLPDLVIPVNPDDYPVGRNDPWFSFCRQRRTFNDLLLPNMVEDGLFPVEMDLKAPRAGRGDTRRPMAIWLGRPMSWSRGKRHAVVRKGLLHPERVYAGLTDWEQVPLADSMSEEEWLQFYKPRMPLDDWARYFKYVINVEGNCGSARLAHQLYADAAVFLVAGEDEEWYYPLLKPFVHFIPVTVAADGTTDLLEQLDWAESHPDEILGIVKASTAFAHRHLAPRNGRDCYTALLLQDFSLLIQDAKNLTAPQGLSPYVSQTPPWSKISREQ